MVPKLTEEEVLSLYNFIGNTSAYGISVPIAIKMRSSALHNLCSEMNVEGFNIGEAKAKIKSLRCTYYLEIDEIEKSTAPDAGGNVYVPKMEWFAELHAFIKNVAVKRKTMVSSCNIYILIMCNNRTS